MTDVKDCINTELEKGVVNDLHLDSKVIHQRMKHSTSRYIRREILDFVFVVNFDLFVNVFSVKPLSFFVSDEHQVQKINKNLL